MKLDFLMKCVIDRVRRSKAARRSTAFRVTTEPLELRVLLTGTGTETMMAGADVPTADATSVDAAFAGIGMASAYTSSQAFVAAMGVGADTSSVNYTAQAETNLASTGATSTTTSWAASTAASIAASAVTSSTPSISVTLSQDISGNQVLNITINGVGNDPMTVVFEGVLSGSTMSAPGDGSYQLVLTTPTYGDATANLQGTTSTTVASVSVVLV